MKNYYDLKKFSTTELVRLDYDYRVAIEGIKALMDIIKVYAGYPDNEDIDSSLDEYLLQIDFNEQLMQELIEVEKAIKILRQNREKVN